MAPVDPYSSCPCGSGQKYKWCCQKVESYAERAQRMVDNGQHEAALKPLEEGLAKFPDSPWLLTQKAVIQLHLEQTEPAKQTLGALLKKQAGHLGGIILLTRLKLETEGGKAGIVPFQQGLSALAPEDRRQLAPLAAFAGVTLSRSGDPIAAIRHLELAMHWGAAQDEGTVRALASLRSSASLSVWEKHPYRLWPPPEGVAEQFRESFERALAWAEDGLFAAAASAFELLAAGSAAGAIADRNRGVCCLWMADDDGAVAALRRFIARTGPTLEAVDLEALCQRLGRDPAGDTVEFVQLSWPIRNRSGLLEALRADSSFEPGSDRPIHATAPEAPAVARFFLLDRPRIAARVGLERREVPCIEGEVLVGTDQVVLETYDDGRLDRLIDRFTARAGSNIPPAHPRTKVIAKEPRAQLALTWRWQIPAGVPEADVHRLRREQWAHLIREVWPETPHPALQGRTPLRAAAAGDAEIPLRAAVRLLETSIEDWQGLIDWDQLRGRLRLPPEPAVDPKALDLDRLHLSRWSSIPAEALDDDRVLALYQRARRLGMATVMNRTARVLADRPSLLVRGRIEALRLFGDLAVDAAHHGDAPGAEAWLRRGRQSEPPLKQNAHALYWELLDVQVKLLLNQPEQWVPLVAGLLQRYRGNREATSAVLTRLTALGLVRAVVDPKHPDQVKLDTQLLDQYLSRYAARVTTAAEDRGKPPAQGAIWTPEPGRSGSPIWTPGSQPSSPGKERPTIIRPGQ